MSSDKELTQVWVLGTSPVLYSGFYSFVILNRLFVRIFLTILFKIYSEMSLWQCPSQDLVLVQIQNVFQSPPGKFCCH